MKRSTESSYVQFNFEHPGVVDPKLVSLSIVPQQGTDGIEYLATKKTYSQQTFGLKPGAWYANEILAVDEDLNKVLDSVLSEKTQLEAAGYVI